MSAPAYRWVCSKCGLANEPGADSCSSCGSPAVVSGLDLEPPVPEGEASRRREATAERNARFMLFFPEIIPAAAITLGSPAWALSLAFRGHILAGILLLAGIAVGAFGFFLSLKRGEKWLAYFAILFVLFVAYLVYSSTASGGSETHAQPCDAPDLARKAAQGR